MTRMHKDTNGCPKTAQNTLFSPMFSPLLAKSTQLTIRVKSTPIVIATTFRAMLTLNHLYPCRSDCGNDSCHVQRDVTKRSPRETKKVAFLQHETMWPHSPQQWGASLNSVMQFKTKEKRMGDFKGHVMGDRDKNVCLRGLGFMKSIFSGVHLDI
jgi:hypothetical protein